MLAPAYKAVRQAAINAWARPELVAMLRLQRGLGITLEKAQTNREEMNLQEMDKWIQSARSKHAEMLRHAADINGGTIMFIQ